jgi:hypothetical protein
MSINSILTPNNTYNLHGQSVRVQTVVVNDFLDRDLYTLPFSTPLPLVPSVVVPDILTGKQLNWVPLSFFLDNYVVPQYLFINTPIDSNGNGLQTEATGGTVINFTRLPQDVIISDGINISPAPVTGQYFSFTPDAFGIYEYNLTFEGYGNDTGAVAQLVTQYALSEAPFTILSENRSAFFEIPFSSTAKITKCNIELNGLFTVNRADCVCVFSLSQQFGTNIITYGASLTMKKVANLPPASVFVPAPVEVFEPVAVSVEVVETVEPVAVSVEVVETVEPLAVSVEVVEPVAVSVEPVVVPKILKNYVKGYKKY